MHIDEVKIYGFGGLRDVSFRFSEGLNLVYGDNESGKTTLFHCLIALFYGMKRSRGRSSLQQDYQRFDPGIQTPYAAAVSLQLAQGEIVIERDFRRPAADRLLVNGKQESIRLLDRWWPVGERWLYLQTFALSGLAALGKEEMIALLQAYVRAAEGGREGFWAERAISLLRREQKLFRQEEQEGQRLQRESDVAMEAEEKLLREQKQRLEQELTALEQGRERHGEVAEEDITDGEEVEGDVYEEGMRPHSAGRRGFFRFLEWLSLLGGLGALGFGLWKQQLPAIIGGAVLLAFTVLLFLYRVIQQDVWQEERLYRWQTQAGQEVDLHRERQRSYRLALRREWEQVAHRLRRLEHKRRQEGGAAQASLTAGARMEDIKDAIRLLQEAMRRQDQELAKRLEDRVNRLYQQLEGRRGVRIGLSGERIFWQEQIGNTALTGQYGAAQSCLEMPQLSTGTLQYVYLLLRLVVMEAWPEPMTYLLDDVLLTLDDGRTVGLLGELADRGGQVILFSRQKREKQLLEEAGHHFTYLQLIKKEQN